MEKLKETIAPFIHFIETGSFFSKIIIALLIFFIGWNIISIITGLFKKYLKKIKFDITLEPFITNLVLWVLRALLFISTASYLGIETTSFIAILGTVGLAVGLALQGSLSNFAGGVLILLLRPFKVGDLVDMQDHLGVVKEIKLFKTILLSPENKTILLPNGAVSNGNIVNYTVEGLIRVDLSVGISYTSNIKKAKETILEVLHSTEYVLKTPAPFVGVVELGDSSVNLAVRPYSKPEHYWDVYFKVYEDMKLALDNAGIEIPFPQLDVHTDK